ncbi:reverse transcriptase domain-containing protein [Tanacetum coccineum]
MANLQFCDKHNMVAFLKKPKNSEGFHEIVDFLNRSTLRYALITNSTIYTSQIKQFWQTATVKTLDSGEVEIKATVDGHDKTITEAFVRSSVQLADTDGIINMSTTKKFEQLALMGVHTPLLPTMLIIGLGEGSAIPAASQHTPIAAEISQSQFPTQTQVADKATFTSVDVNAGGAATTDISLDAGQGSGTIHKTPTMLNDAPLSGVNTPGSVEGSLSQTELMDFRVKSLEDQSKTEKSKFTKRKFQIVISEDEVDLPAEDSSKQGRMMKYIDLDVDTSLVQPHAIEDFHFVTPTKIRASGEAHSSDISSEDQLGVLSAAKILANAGRSKTVSEVQTYIRRRDVNTGSEGVNTAGDTANVMHQNVNILIPSSSLKDKDPGQIEGKGVIEVDEIQKKFKKGEYKQIKQEKYDLEKAVELQKQLDERKEVVVEEAHDIVWSDPDVLRYHALQNRSFSVAEDSEIEKEVMKRPGFDLQQESIKKNEKIEASGFVQKQPAEEEKKKKKDAESSKQVEEETVQQEDVVAEQVVKESSKKAGGKLKRKVAKGREDKDKRQKMQDDPEKLTLMEYVEVISDSEEIIRYYEIHRADGSYKTYIYFSEMLNDFDREDLIMLYRLFNEKYASTRPGFDDLVLWGDMKIMFEPDGDDAVWKNHHSQELIEWKLYDSCGVHSLMLGEVSIHMLVEKKYPLPHDTLTRMLQWKLHVNYNVTEMAYELLRFIKSQLHQGGLLGINLHKLVLLVQETTNLKIDNTNFQQWFDETFSEAWGRFKDLLRKCPHHGFSELHQIDTFYNALTQFDQNYLNAATSGNLLNRTPRDALTIIENKSKVRTSRNKPVVSKVSAATSSSTSAYLPEITPLTDAVKAMLLQNKTPSPAPVKAIEEICVTCSRPRLIMSVLLPRATLLMLLQLQGPIIKEVPDTVLKEKLIIVLAIKRDHPVFLNRMCKTIKTGTIRIISIKEIRFIKLRLIKLRPLNDFSNYMKTNYVNMRAIQNQINNMKVEFKNGVQTTMRNQSNELKNDIKNMMSNFFQMQSPSGLGSLPSNTIANPRGDLKAITTRSGVSYDGPTIPPTSSPLPKEVECEPEATKDKVKTTNLGSTAHVQPPVTQVPIPEPDVASKPNPKPSIPYPLRLNYQKLREKANNQMLKFLQIFQRLHFDLSFADALLHMPKFASMFKSLLSNKEKLFELTNTPLNENCLAVLLKKLLEKLGDPDKFLIPCDFPELDECLALSDLGASINLMPLSVWKKFSLSELTLTRVTLELANRSVAYPVGVAEDVFVKVGKFHFPTDFVVVDYDVDPRVPLILGRPFLRTARALIDVHGEELTLRVNDEAITFNVRHTLRYSYRYDDESVNRINVIDVTCEEYAQEVLGFSYSSKM